VTGDLAKGDQIMPSPARCALLALAFAVSAVPAANAGPYDDEYLEPHEVLKARYESRFERRHYPEGYSRYEPRDGRYPGHLYYTRPAPGGRLAADYSLSYTGRYKLPEPRAYEYRRAYAGAPYYVRERSSYRRTAPRRSASTSTESGYRLSTRTSSSRSTPRQDSSGRSLATGSR
jgi:hypothetical protein